MMSKRERYTLLLAQHFSETARAGHAALSLAQLVSIAETFQLGEARPLDLSNAILDEVTKKLKFALDVGGIPAGVTCWNILFPDANQTILELIDNTADEAAGRARLAEFEKDVFESLEPN